MDSKKITQRLKRVRLAVARVFYSRTVFVLIIGLATGYILGLLRIHHAILSWMTPHIAAESLTRHLKSLVTSSGIR